MKEVHAQDFSIYAKTVIARVTVQAAAERFNFRGDLFGISGGGPFEQRLCQKQCLAIVFDVLSENPSLKNTAKLHERKPMILFDQKPKPIGQNKFLNRVIDNFFGGLDPLQDRA